MEGVRVVGITSRTISKAEKLAKNFHIKNIYENIDNLIENCAVDALMILVSADHIFNVTKKLLPIHIPLFIEKPPGLIPEQTKILAKLADKNGTINMVGYNRRYYSIFHKGLEIIHKHGRLFGIAVEGHERFWKIGDSSISEKIRENWIYANSTHTIDLLNLFGGGVKKINALKNNFKEKNGDQFAVALEFETGVIGTYTSHWYSPGGWSVKLYGDGITVVFEPLEAGVWIDKDFQKYKIDPDKIDIKFKPGFFQQMEAFINMVKTGKLEHPGMSLENALKTMLLAEKFVNA